MRIGVHMRRSRGYQTAAQQAAEIGCETIQVFAANPNSWRSPDIDPEVAASFRESTQELDLNPVVIHTPYLLNLASPDPEIHGKSTRALADSMSRADILGAQYVVTHIGSHRGTGLKEGLKQIRRAVSSALTEAPTSAILLLEDSAGAGDAIGSKFEELCAILDRLENYGDRLGICLDTAHLWGAGYDISSPDSVAETLEDFNRQVGFRWLMLMHMNDTRVALGSRRDRHANIGTGNIGECGFEALLNHPTLVPLAGIIETPARTIQDDVRDIDILKRLRGD